jgi:hypothetical protein
MQNSKATEERPIPAYDQAMRRRDIEARDILGMKRLWVVDTDRQRSSAKAAEYRGRADEARIRAGGTGDIRIRLSLVQIADTWERMAAYEERPERLFGSPVQGGDL